MDFSSEAIMVTTITKEALNTPFRINEISEPFQKIRISGTGVAIPKAVVVARCKGT
jgi:hypothetical protein